SARSLPRSVPDGLRPPARARRLRHPGQRPAPQRRRPRGPGGGARPRPRHGPGPPLPAAVPRDVDAAPLGRRPPRPHPARPPRPSWAAGRTDRIRLAPSVLSVPVRPPAVVARAAASLDLLSGGRLTLALGAGHFWDAMEAMGVPRLTPGESVDALEEAVEVVRGVWRAADPSPFTYRGEHHRLTGAARGPAPAHDVPVWVGGGRRRMLDLVGRIAEGWVAPGGTAAVAHLHDANAMIDVAATAAGRD